MKVHQRISSSTMICVMALAGSGMATSALGQEIRFIPIRLSPFPSPVGTVGTPVAPVFNGTCWELRVSFGGIEVDLDLQAFGWGNAAGSPALGSIQATVDSSGYDNDAGGPIGDLNPKGWPASPKDGAYQAKKACSDNFDPCVAPFDPTCGGGANGFCIANPDWVIPSCTSEIPSPVTTSSLNYTWAALTINGCNIDDGLVKTMGGLILEVPNDAAGTYVIEINPDPNISNMTTGTFQPIPGVVFIPACITVITGKCCFGIGSGGAGCTDGITEGTCNALFGPRLFKGDESCTGDLDADCPSCANDGDCDDGDACTDDICDISFGEQFGDCRDPSPLNFDPAVDCCNSLALFDVRLTRIDDDDVCTGTGPGNTDVCNPDGTVSHAFNTAPCDDGNECMFDDTCDQGVCIGTDVNGIPCLSNLDCPVAVCNITLGVCECLLVGDGACCDRAASTCTNQVGFDDCVLPSEFHEGLSCVDLPDADGDGVQDCIDKCPGIDDAVFAPECEGAIPTVSEWGLVILALLLLASGKVYFNRRRSATT